MILMSEVLKLYRGKPESLLGRLGVLIENSSGTYSDSPRFLSLVGGVNVLNYIRAYESIGSLVRKDREELFERARKHKKQKRKDQKKLESDLGKSENPEEDRIYLAHEQRLRDMFPIYSVMDFWPDETGVDADVIYAGEAANSTYCTKIMEDQWTIYVNVFKGQLLSRRLYGTSMAEASAALEEALRAKTGGAGVAYRQLREIARGKPYSKDVELLGGFLKQPDVALLYLEKIRHIEVGQYEHAARIRDEINSRLKDPSAKPVA